MKKVIINADDFGYSSGVNSGIIKAFQNGILTSTTLMANMQGSEEAIKLAKDNPKLGVGCHLVLTCGKPKSSGQSLVNKNGDFYNLDQYKQARNSMISTEIYDEWCKQIEYLLESGLKLTHLDSHHHVHAFPENIEITSQISNKYKLPFRNVLNLDKAKCLPYQYGVKDLIDMMNFPEIRDMKNSYNDKNSRYLDEIKAIFNSIQEDEIIELMVHPAFVDEYLYFNSSFSIERVREVSILCDPKIRELVIENSLMLCHYGELKIGGN